MAGIEGKVVLVTGASSGIGESAVRQLAARGARVVAGARRTDRLERIVADVRAAGGQGTYRALDVTSLEDFQSFVAHAESAFGRIDVIVNNAGVMPLSPLEALKVDEWNRMIDVNVRGVLHGIAAGLPRFLAHRSGHFVNVSSIGGHRVIQTGSVYSATKFAVRAISEGLRQETDRVRVTVISPGVVESELADTITHESTKQMIEAFRKIALPADSIAAAIAYAIEQPDGVDVNEILVRPTAARS